MKSIKEFIEMHDTTVETRFFLGHVVFKITSLTELDGEESQRDVGIVTDYEHYKNKIKNHTYDPLIALAPLPIRLAYLFDCLNRQLYKKRDNIFVFWWRTLKTDKWHRWFTVYPYEEKF